MRLNLYLKPETDKFCCTDGTCIDWSFRCDNVPNCSDESDEYNCTVLIRRNKYDSDKQPQVKNILMVSENYTTEMKIEVKVDFIIKDIFRFNEKDSTMTLKYKVRREWTDNRLYFRDLKWDKTQNEIDLDDIWYPELDNPSNLKRLIKADYPGVFVKRKSNFTWYNEMDELLRSKIFEGSKNPIVMAKTEHLELFCVFENLAMYPFDEESCKIRIKFLGGHSNFINLLPRIINKGPEAFSQYDIKEWKIAVEKNDSVLVIVVELYLKRNIATIVMVVYLPTLLMNIINQSLNFLSARGQFADFATIIKVNVTCMIVIAMVYDSVSKYLVSTPQIKMIEIWLISSLIYTFACIVINIRLRLLDSCLTKVENIDATNMIFVESAGKDIKESKEEYKEQKKMNRGKLGESCYENREAFFLQRVIFYVLPFIYILFIIIYSVSALSMKY